MTMIAGKTDLKYLLQVVATNHKMFMDLTLQKQMIKNDQPDIVFQSKIAF